MFQLKTFPKPQPSGEMGSSPRLWEEKQLPTSLETTGYTGSWVNLLPEAGRLCFYQSELI